MRALARTSLERTVELGEHDHGDAELLGHDLEATTHLGDLDGAVAVVVLARRRIHQLQVVQDDDGPLLVVEHTARLGADLGDRGARRVVNEDIEAAELADRLVDVRPLSGEMRPVRKFDMLTMA